MAAVLLACPGPARAEAERTRAYAVTAWSAETGTSPGDVFAITQDLEGYLWLGTPTGLVRFDGFRFVRWVSETGTPVSGPVLSLVGARDGSVWVGAAAAVYKVNGGAVRQFTPDDGLLGGGTSMIEDRSGRIWVGNRRGLFRFGDGRWQLMRDDEGYPGAEVFSLHEDHSGRLWIGSTAGVYRWAEGKFELMDPASTNVQAITEDTTGAVWVTDINNAVRRLDPRLPLTYTREVRRPASGWRLLHDRHGQVWVAALGGGLLRVDHASETSAIVRRVDYEQRATGATRSLYEDREGNIWVGLRGGLIRLSEAVFDTSTVLDGLTQDGVRTSAVSADGAVWIATGHNVTRFAGDERTTYPLSQTLALYRDGPSGMWASTNTGLWRLRGGRFAPVPVREPVLWGRVQALTTVEPDTLWLCSTARGIMTWDGHALGNLDHEPSLAGRSCSTMLRDRRGRIWMGFTGGGAVVYDRGTLQSLGEAEGLTRGQVVAITEDRAGGVWLATSGGLSRYQNGRITAVTQANAPLTEVVPSLVEDDEGFMWVGINAGAALVRLHPRELDKLAVDAGAPLEYELYDSSDGIPQGTLGWQGGVTGVRGGDGRLWFAAGLGVATIDPRERPRGRRARTPQVESVTADGRSVALARGLELPARTSTLRIEYGAVSLSSASKLRFRYMLEGRSDQWVSVGTTRDVVFSDLPSGNYRFRVSSTYDGEWADAASWDFSVAPPLYRTRGFLLMFAAVLTLLLAAAWWLRLRSVRNQYSLVFAERARMGREIHDTLLQSLAAIGFELETIAAQVDPAQNRLRDSVRLLRLQVGHSLREARESVLDLRRTPMKGRGLVQSLTDLAEHTSRTGLPTEFTVDGRLGSLPDEVEVQLFRIAQEAVSNARKHGHPAHLWLALRPRPGSLVLSVEDDGKGFDPDHHASAPDMGHQLGLLSMRERAERVQGTLAIRSAPGQGTTIEATVPVPSV